MNKDKLMKVAKIAVPIVGVVVSLATSVLSDKKMEETIDKKVTEALAKKAEEEL